MTFPCRRVRLLALAAVCSALAADSFADDNYWTGGASYWDLSSSWTLGAPAGGQRLFLGYSPYAFTGATTFRSGSTSVASLFSKNALNVTGGSLSLTSTSETSTIDAALNVSGGTLGGAANLNVAGLTTLTGGTLGGSGTLAANGGIAISGNGTVTLADTRVLTNTAVMTWSGATVNASAGSTVVNASGGSFAANATAVWTSGGLTNAGTMTHTVGTSQFKNVVFANTGTVSASAGEIRFVSPTSFSNTGTISAGGTGKVTLQGGSYDVTGSGYATSGGGTISFSGATLTGGQFAPWTIPASAPTGSISLSGSTLQVGFVRNSNLLGFQGSNTLDGVTGDKGFRFVNGGTQTVLNGFTPGGSVVLDYGSQVKFTGDRTIGYGVVVQEAATNPTAGLTAAGGSNVTIGSTGSWTGTGGKINAGGSAFNFRNDGAMDATSVLVVDVAGGTLTNAGTIVGHAQNSDYSGGSVLSVGTGSFVNSGTIRGDGGGVSLTGSGPTSFSNTGTIEAVNGGSVGVYKSTSATGVSWTNAGLLRADGVGSRLYLGGTFTQSSLGNFSITNGACAVVYAGTLNDTGNTLVIGAPNAWMLSNGGRILGGSIAGSGNLGFETPSPANVLENVGLDGGLNVGAGWVKLVGTTHLNGNTTLAGGRIDFTDDVVVDHDVVGGMTLGMLKANGTITVANGATVQGGIGINSLYPTVANVNLVNNGTMRGTDAGYFSGTLTNHGLLEQNANTLTFYNQGASTNDGTMLANGGTIFAGNGRFTNSGMMTVSNGGTLNLKTYGTGQTLFNAGTIAATGTGSSIKLAMSSPFTLASLGDIRATNGAYLSVYGNGQLDNTGQTLVLGSGNQGSWAVEGGGTIFGGAIQNSELLNVSSTLNQKMLRDVSVDHGLNVGGGVVTLSGGFASGGTIGLSGAGTLNYSSDRTINYPIRFDGAAGENGTINLGTTTFGGSPTIVPGGEITGRNVSLSLSPNSLSIVNQGLVQASGMGGKVEITGSIQNSGTMRATNGGALKVGDYGTLLNVSGTTLAGGTYQADSASTVQVRGLDVHENAATIVLNGANSKLQDTNGNDALRNLSLNSGTLSLGGGRGLSFTQAIQNSGVVSLGSSSILASGGFLQTETGRLAIGFDAGGVGALAIKGNVSLVGALDISSMNGYTPMVGSRYTFLTYTGALSGSLSYDATRWAVTYTPGSVYFQPLAATPEPTSLAALGLGAMAFVRRRRSV